MLTPSIHRLLYPAPVDKKLTVNILPGNRPTRERRMKKNGDILDILVEDAADDADGFKSLSTDYIS